MLRAFVKFYFILFCLGLFSCEIFKTRTPAEPSEKSSLYEPPTEPEIVIKNIINSLQEGNSVNYSKSFSDISFVFEASTSAKNKYGAELISWDKSKEKRYFENVQNKLQKYSKISIEFTQTNYNVSSDKCDVIAFYRMIVPHTIAGEATEFRGQAQFQLTRDSKTGEWAITIWTDTDIGSAATDSTWSHLKGVFITQ